MLCCGVAGSSAHRWVDLRTLSDRKDATAGDIALSSSPSLKKNSDRSRRLRSRPSVRPKSSNIVSRKVAVSNITGRSNTLAFTLPSSIDTSSPTIFMKLGPRLLARLLYVETTRQKNQTSFVTLLSRNAARSKCHTAAGEASGPLARAEISTSG